MTDEDGAVQSGHPRAHGRASLKTVGERAAVAELIAQLSSSLAIGAEGGVESGAAGASAEGGALAARNVVIGPGDDGAALHLPAGEACVVTTDSLVEGVHFERVWTTPADLGYKLIQSATSDIGAMGGRPCACVLALSAPGALLESELLGIIGGALEAAARHHLLVLGGDTASSPLLVLTATVIGSARAESLRTRGGAGPGDRILVTGELGDAAAGLRVLRKLQVLEPPPAHTPHAWLRAASPLADLERRLAAKHLVPRADSPEALALAGAVRSFLRPSPPIAAGPIAAAAGATALIDISDGLASELHLLAAASHVGLAVDEARVPIGQGARRVALENGEDPLELAFGGGEDYELLMTVPADRAQTLATELAAIGVRTSEIGEVVRPEFGLTLRAPGAPPRALAVGGYEHFREG